MAAITSVKINGVENISNIIWGPQKTKITHGMMDEIGEAKLVVKGTASSLATNVLASHTVEVYEGATLIFTGKIVRLEPEAQVVAASGAGRTNIVLTCLDNGRQLQGAVITTEVTYTAASDSSIIAAHFGALLPSVNLTNVTTVDSTVDIRVAAGWTLRQLLSELAARTGAVYYFDPAANALWYHAATAQAAPFAIKETWAASAPTSYAPKRAVKPTIEWTEQYNRYVVYGQPSSGGTRITATRNDATSQGVYGILTGVIVDDNLTTTTDLNQRGDIALARTANPLVSGTLETDVTGLKVGQLISIILPSKILNGSYIIRKLTRYWIDGTEERYVISFGDWRPDLARTLKNTIQATKTPAYTPVAYPTLGSVGSTHFAAGIEPVGLVNQAPNGSGELAISLTSKVVYNSNDAKTYRWDAGSGTYKRKAGVGDLEADSVIAGTVATAAIRAIDAAFDAAAIQNADIASLGASKLTAGTIDASVINVINMNASNITTGTLSANFISGGTISASVTLTAPTLVITSGSTTINIDATNLYKFVNTASSGKIQMYTTPEVRVGTSSDTVYARHLGAAFNIVNAGQDHVSLDDSSGGRLTLKSGSTVRVQASASGGSLVLKGSGGLTALQMGTLLSSDHGQLYIYNSSGTIKFSFDPALGGLDCVDGYQVNATTVITSGRNFAGVNIDMSGIYQMDGNTVIDSSRYFVGAGVNTAGNVTCSVVGAVDIDITGVYKMDGTTIIDSSKNIAIGSSTVTADRLISNAGYGSNVWAGSAGLKLAGGFVQLNGSGQATVNTGLSSITAFIAIISTGNTPAQYLEANGTPSAMVVHSSLVTSNDFFYWLAFGAA